MTEKIQLNLKKLGQHEARLPNSIAVCLDFIAIWGSDINRAQLAHLCSAAIAVGLDHAKCLPAYPVQSGDPVKFGFKVMERLLEAGCTPSDIYDGGTQILTAMLGMIPTEEQVNTQANFT